jgi:hypothetical protein
LFFFKKKKKKKKRRMGRRRRRNERRKRVLLLEKSKVSPLLSRTTIVSLSALHHTSCYFSFPLFFLLVFV